MKDEFDRNKEIAFKLANEVLEKRDQVEREFAKKFAELTNEVVEIAEKYGIPIRDNSGGSWAERGDWVYVPESINQWPEETLAEKMDEAWEYWEMSNMIENAGDWIGSSC